MTWRKNANPSENCPPEEKPIVENPPKRKVSKRAKEVITEQLIDPATGELYKSGEYPLGRNLPVP